MSPARRRRLQVGPVLWLTTVWVLLWGNPSWANLLGGLAVAVAVLAAFPLPQLSTGVRVRPAAMAALVGWFLVDVVRASFHVSWVVLRPRPLPRSSVVTTRLSSDNELLQMVVAQMLSLVPGAIVVELDTGTRDLSMHVLGADSASDVVQAHERVRGPGMLDRVVALDVLIAILICAMGVEAAFNRHTTTLPIIISLSLVGFVGSVSVARYAARDRDDDQGQVR